MINNGKMAPILIKRFGDGDLFPLKWLPRGNWYRTEDVNIEAGLFVLDSETTGLKRYQGKIIDQFDPEEVSLDVRLREFGSDEFRDSDLFRLPYGLVAELHTRGSTETHGFFVPARTNAGFFPINVSTLCIYRGSCSNKVKNIIGMLPEFKFAEPEQIDSDE